MPSLGQSLPHDSALGHVTGEARYVDDLPPFSNELYVDFAGSPCASGRIVSIDTSRAAAMPGVVAVYTHKDIPGHNRFGGIFVDEPFLADDEVSYIGQPVVGIAAESREALRRARRAVRIEIEETPPVLTIEEAIARGSYIGPPRRIRRGDFESAWAAAPHRIEGVFRNGGQEQFYFESQAAIAWPAEFGQIAIHASTQNPTETQHFIAEVLGLSMHRVVCFCKRMGGGFGGKETQAALPSLLAALTALRTGRPARAAYTKDDDMKVTGKRHEFRTEYRIGFDGEGRILCARIDFHSNGGAFADLSTAILERALLHAENAYYIPNIEIHGRVCRTNLPPNTAMRGFGGPQAVAAIENAIEEIAARLGRDPLDVRRVNLYGADAPRNMTPYGQTVEHFHLPAMIERLAAESRYAERRAEIARHNASLREPNAAAAPAPDTLRGLALTPIKFGISFTTKFLNQGNALVNVYEDGTAQVSTGATEMGQGVNTKIRQLAADALGLPAAAVALMPTSTEKNPNTSPTAASTGTDLNGEAAVRACREIRARLAEFAAPILADPARGLAPSPADIVFEEGVVYDRRSPHRQLPFAELAGRARRERIDLGARGFYATPIQGFDRESGTGQPFAYFTTGCAVSEVAIDRLTGDLRVERVDLIIDIGRLINPGIDRGQVIGGFVQGMGWVTTECLVYSERGELLSFSPTTYKIPNITDIPRVFNVTFEPNDNPAAVAGSKAVGEPPFLLGISVWAAVKNALLSAAPEGEIPWLPLPATNEAILMALTDLERRRQSRQPATDKKSA